MEKNYYELKFEVRDYELDLEGIVNNANYFHYFEHTRHKHLNLLGINVKEMHDNGYDLMMIKTETHYKQPLRTADTFIVTSTFSRLSRLKVNFNHTIRKVSDDTLVSTSDNTVICLSRDTQKPCMPSFLEDIIKTTID